MMNSEKTVRSFADEYRKYAKSSAPDLWDRIEAGVDALETAAESGAEAEAKKDAGIQEKSDHTVDGKMTDGSNIVSIASSERYKDFSKETFGTADDGNTDTNVNTKTNTNADTYKNTHTEQKEQSGGGKKRINISRYMGVIAAAACGLLVISAMGWISLSSRSNSAAEAAYAPAAAPALSAADESADEEAAAAPEMMAEASADEGAEMMAEAATDEDAEMMAEESSDAEEGYPEEYEEAADDSNADSVPATYAAETNGAHTGESDSYEEEEQDSYKEEAAEEAYDADGTTYGADDDETLKPEAKEEATDTDRAEGLNASSESKKAAKQKNADKDRQKEQQLTVTLDSLKEENGKLHLTMIISDPGITKHKEGDTVTATVNEPIRSRVSRFYGKNKTSGKDLYVVTLIPLDSGFLITDIRQEL